MSGRGTADFSTPTKRLIAERAGFRCSVPSCPIITIGPGYSANETASVGIAAHINSASLNGPRGRGALSEDHLRNIQNGIWCCANHGREIDTNSGRGYTVATLIAWKKLREEQARRERSGIDTPYCWVDSIEIVRSFLFRPRQKFTLGKCTMISGANASGKSGTLEWIALANGREIRRWRSANLGETRLKIVFANPERHELEFTFEGNQRRYWRDGVSQHTPSTEMHVVLLPEGVRQRAQWADDLEMIASALGVDKNIVRNLIGEISSNGSEFFRRIRFNDDDCLSERDVDPERTEPYAEVLVDLDDGLAERSYNSLSGSERVRLFSEFAFALAREKARNAPTILMLDGGDWSFSAGSVADLARYALMQPFQTLWIFEAKSREASIWDQIDQISFNRADQRTTIV